MEEFENNDDFLAKWASGELSEAEKEAFRKSEDYAYYQAILEGTDVLEVPSYDKNALFKKVQQKKADKGRVVSLVPRWAYAVAASIALLLGYVWYMNRTIDYSTGFGEQLTIQLPDASEVILNANSELTYNPKEWKKGHRITNLEGAAFFEVEKGSDFVVSTPNGEVTVLGTQFTVNTYGNLFEVICYEGKVKVAENTTSKVLSQGDAIRIHNGAIESWEIDGSTPTWIQGESTFSNAPLYQVINALQNQYGIVIKSDNVDVEQRFRGSFTHNDLNIALRAVFESMQIKVTFTDKSTIVLDEN